MGRLEKTAEALKRNGIETVIVDNPSELLRYLENLVPENARVASGGSVTLEETGVVRWLGDGRRVYVAGDPHRKDLDVRAAYDCDWYFMSSNAITEQGELYNVDGGGNRVASLIYGPQKVVVVAGENKIVKDLQEARKRVKQIAAPKNCRRLGKKTGCMKTGSCTECRSPERICCTEVTIMYQREKERILVILLRGSYGY